MIHALTELERIALGQAQSFRKDLGLLVELASLAGEPVPYRPTFKDGLVRVVDEFDRLAASAEQLAPRLKPTEAPEALDMLGRALQEWAEINADIDLLMTLVLRGSLDRGYQLLSPIANNANLRGRRRLLHLYDRLSETVRSAHAAEPAAEPRPAALLLPRIEHTQEIALPPEWDLSTGAAAPLSRRAAGGSLDYAFLFMEPGAEAEAPRSFEECVARLSSPDELERNDALAELLTRHEPELVGSLIRGAAIRDEALGHVLELLWRSAEMVLLEDFFYSARRSKLTSFLVMAEPYPAARRFNRLLQLFRPEGRGYSAPEEALAPVEREHPAELRTFLKALLIHPIEEYRRYAISRLPPSEYWSVVSYPHTPPPALADVLDRLALPDVPDDHRKVFFDCVVKTLGGASSVLEVRAARRIINTLFSFDFFMEDEYFHKILALGEGVAREELRLGLEDPMIERTVSVLREWKERLGPQATRPPDFTGLPLTLQRMLAREGRYVLLFACHPNPKIALETLPYLATPGVAEQAARLSTVNGLLLVELAKRDELFRTQAGRLALLGNPKAPVAAAQRLAPLLPRLELERLARSRDINPEVGVYLRGFLARKPASATQ